MSTSTNTRAGMSVSNSTGRDTDYKLTSGGE